MIGRLIGWLLVLASVSVAVRDGLDWLDRGTLRLTAAGELWASLDTPSLNFTQAIIQRYLLPELWDPAIVTVLLWPAVFVLLVPGIILLILFRKKPKRPKLLVR